MNDDADLVVIHDQIEADLDVITDGEQSRLDFNLSFYGYLQGIEANEKPLRVFGPPAHDQRGKHNTTGELMASRGLGVVEEYQRLVRWLPLAPLLKPACRALYLEWKIEFQSTVSRSLCHHRGAASLSMGVTLHAA